MIRILRCAGKLARLIITLLLASLLACNIYFIFMEHVVAKRILPYLAIP